MPLTIIGTFEIKRLDILDEKGNCDEKVMPKLSKDQMLKLYELMVLTRALDDKALALQRQGRMGTYASIRGQEASDVGSAFALSKEDWMFPTYRQNGAYITRGFPMEKLLQWSWDERGMRIPDGENDFTLSIPIATQVTHAVGAAWAANLQKKKTAVLAYLGDGGTSESDFSAAMNFAGVYRVPCVILCENNHFAISLPVERQTASSTIAQKAIAFGFDGIQVDGNDVFAVYKSVKDAVDKAKAGGGPTFIEAVTYRISDHTTADDASRYRSKQEVALWEQKDPIRRLQIYLKKKKIWTESYQKVLDKRIASQVEEAVACYDTISTPDIKDIFLYTYKTMTPQLQEQFEYIQGIEREKQAFPNR